MSNTDEKTLIGAAEKVKFPTLGDIKLHARIDTGAKSSSMWALSVRETEGVLHVEFPGEGTDPLESKTSHTFSRYETVRVASSMGHVQLRYKVRMPIVIKKRRILATFTLSDRSSQVYPVLIGRVTLMGKFVVDVSKGSVMREKERERSLQLQNSGVEVRV